MQQPCFDPSTRASALAGSSRSGFRPTGVLEGATGLPVGHPQDAAPAYEDRMASARRKLSAIARRRIALRAFFLYAAEPRRSSIGSALS